jgi:MFS family permease
MTRLYRNSSFVRLFLGRIVTNAGDSVYAVAAMWLVYDLTGSSFYTGLAGFLVFGTQPLQVLVGPLVDRWSLRRVLVGTQFVQLVGVLIVPLADATGYLSVWLVIVLMPVLEFLNQFVYPAQHAALPRIVEKDQLVRANSAFSFAYQGIDMVFNAAAGALIALVGAVTLYLLDAVTFALALLLFIGLAVPQASDVVKFDDSDDSSENTDTESVVSRYVGELTDGFGYIRGSVVLLFLLGAMVINFAFGMMMAVLPAFADSLGGPEAYGLLSAAFGAGNLVGAAGASLVEEFPYGRVVVVGRVISATFLFAALIVPGLWSTIFLFFCSFVPGGATSVMGSSLLQSAVSDSILGRVMSVRNSVSTLLMPVGALLGGTVATAAGNTMVMAGVGVASIFYAAYFLAIPSLRSLPSVTEVDEGALGLPKSAASAGGAKTRSDVDDLSS